VDERVVAVLGALGSGKNGVCFSYTCKVEMSGFYIFQSK
jgi:hypothetical protein